MNDRQQELIEIVMEMMSETADIYKNDPHYAPPQWIIENWWATLNVVLTSSSSSDDEQGA